MSKKNLPSALERYQLIRLHLEDDVPLPKLVEKYGFGLSTLKRWVKNYREYGLEGLNRTNRSDKGKRRKINETIIQVVEALALQKPPLSIAAIQRKASDIALRENWKEPTYMVVYDIIKNIDPGLLKLAHEGSKAYSEAFELIHRREANEPNEMWQADHTPLDILLINDRGQPAIPWLTVIIDDYSRAISGFFISFSNITGKNLVWNLSGIALPIQRRLQLLYVLPMVTSA